MPTLEQQEIAVLKSRVSRLEARLEFIYQHFGVTFVADAYPTDDPKIVEALKANQLIEAVRLYRRNTGVSLAEAKSAVEAIQARLGI